MHQRGFTLLELLITILLAAILITLGVPAFRGVVVSNRLSAQTSTLVTLFTLARSEAVRRGVDVSACAKTAGKATAWTNGVAIRVGGCASTDPLVRVSDPIAANGSGLTLTAPTDNSSSTVTSITFNELGALSSPSSASATLPIKFTLSDGSHSQSVCVSAVGHLQTLSDGASCGS